MVEGRQGRADGKNNSGERGIPFPHNEISHQGGSREMITVRWPTPCLFATTRETARNRHNAVNDLKGGKNRKEREVGNALYCQSVA